MADPLSIAGGVVGIVAFTQQLVEATIKIKAFFKDVKNAPKEIENYVNHLGHASKVLERLARDRDDDELDEAIYNESLELFHQALDPITTLVNELEAKMKARRWARFGVALKDKQIQDMLLKLDRSTSQLHFAFNIVETARMKRLMATCQQQASEIRKQLVMLTTTLQLQQGSDQKSDTSVDRRPTKERKANTFHRNKVRIQLPRWLWQVVWDISWESAACGWTVSLQPVTIIPDEHEVWWICRNGDLDGLIYLLETRKIGLNVQDEYGDTLWKASMLLTQVTAAIWGTDSTSLRWANTDMSRFLIDHGASAEDLTRYRRYFELIEELNLLDEGQSEDDYWHLLTSSFMMLPSDWTEEQTLTVAARLRFDFTAEAFHLLGGHSISSRLWFITVSGRHGQTETLMRCIGDWWVLQSDPKGGGEMLSSVLTQGARAGADISQLTANDDGVLVTPFFNMILNSLMGVREAARVNHDIQQWVSCLAQGGMSLCTYGIAEHAHRQTLLTQGHWIPKTFVGLAHGSRPSDWYLWDKHPGDVFAGLFWDMLDHPERAMPGAWEDTTTNEHLDYVEFCATLELDRQAGAEAKIIRRWRRLLKRNEHYALPALCNTESFKNLVEVMELNAKDWKSGNMTSVSHDWHKELLERMREAGLNRRFVVGRKYSKRDTRHLLWARG
ncbi:uncharacterized protein LTR77_010736 [Saxophila tyrrhenica]|uniref:Fungal N-terminal domain-containing protein n=1 Tax=Saxophila tyrrhenica TaxID=1690608 RepID=A0AAV9NWB3_9PEZI|nr:hypothetical protein LTR77_010736 [Saxophila tyrrhenica]